MIVRQAFAWPSDKAACGACRWSGLIRGAVSVALVYYYFDPDGKSSDSHQSTLIATTLIEVMVSIFIFGAATKPLLDYLIGPQGETLPSTTHRPCNPNGQHNCRRCQEATRPGSMWSDETVQACVKRYIAKQQHCTLPWVRRRWSL